METSPNLKEIEKACLFTVAKWFQSIIGDQTKNQHLDKLFFDALHELPDLNETGKMIVQRNKNYDKSSKSFKALFKRANLPLEYFPEVKITVDTRNENLVILFFENQSPIPLLTINDFESKYLEV